jgi:hypothetical protein
MSDARAPKRAILVIEGRRPERLVAPLSFEDGSDIGLYFATGAHLEAAAVLAFEHLVEELCTHEAPIELVDGARHARDDEVRHVRAMSRLARRYGAVPVSARMEPTPIRDLGSIAIENEVEGIVRETLGAAIATWRADHAEDRDVRAAMRIIAVDEHEHADFSWRLGTWLRSRLDEPTRARLDAARSAAIAELYDAFVDPAPDVKRAAGAPDRHDVRRMLLDLERTVWLPPGEGRPDGENEDGEDGTEPRSAA